MDRRGREAKKVGNGMEKKEERERARERERERERKRKSFSCSWCSNVRMAEGRECRQRLMM